MKKIELLAPAGSINGFWAAIHAGCDAVYLGGKLFNARSFANNFSNEQLIEVINNAHLYGVRVYVTVNTLIYDDEVDEFINYIDFLHRNNVDAVIVQDLGMIDLIRKTYPNLEVHVSTQAHVHNLDGVLMMEKLGAKRVVLARETSIEEVKRIKENSNIELEIFTFGALCVSYSGQCLMSSLIGNRSGNRGECAGSCRLPYSLINRNGVKVEQNDFPLSLKDLNTLSYVDALIESGVSSLKIEGRMKSAEYVYKVVSTYRKAIDNYYLNGKSLIDDNDINEIKKIFNRNFTKGFLFNESINNIGSSFRPNHMGINVGKIVDYHNHYAFIKLNTNINIGDALRVLGDSFNDDLGIVVNDFYIDKRLVKSAGEDDIIKIKVNGAVKVNSEVLKTSDALLVKKINDAIILNKRKVLIDIKVEALKDKNLMIKMSDQVNLASVEGSIICNASNKATTKDDIISKVCKLGDTVYGVNHIDILIDDNIFVPMSELNDLRRRACDLLNNKRLYKTNYKKDKYSILVPDFNKERLLSKDEGVENSCSDKVDIIYSSSETNNTILKLPRVIDNYDKYINYNGSILVGEIGAFNRLTNIITDFSLNVVNSYTVALLHSLGALRVTLSLEMNDEQIIRLVSDYKKRYGKIPNLELITLGETEMMISKYSLNKLYHEDLLYLVDRMGYKYRVETRNGLMYIYNLKKRNIYNTKYYDIGINCLRI